jgi:hypothetical protein
MTSRIIEAEWLDVLPAGDARAIRSRRDLRRVNFLMLQAAIMRRLLLRHCGPEKPHSIVELGCGDGTFMLQVARKLAPRWPGVALTLVDRQDIVSDGTRAAFQALGWDIETVKADVFDFLAEVHHPVAGVVTANLFLHHFSELHLTRLFARLAELTPFFAACEPRRSALALTASRLLWAVGCNDVSRHDARISVRAGFAADELSALWPRDLDFDLFEHSAGLFTHCFTARRNRRSP